LFNWCLHFESGSERNKKQPITQRERKPKEMLNTQDIARLEFESLLKDDHDFANQFCDFSPNGYNEKDFIEWYEDVYLANQCNGD
jgi:hypothetical protein